MTWDKNELLRRIVDTFSILDIPSSTTIESIKTILGNLSIFSEHLSIYTPLRSFDS